jgi:hypothetical protein
VNSEAIHREGVVYNRSRGLDARSKKKKKPRAYALPLTANRPAALLLLLCPRLCVSHYECRSLISLATAPYPLVRNNPHTSGL